MPVVGAEGAVPSGDTVVCALPFDVSAPRLARTAVRSVLTWWGAPAELVDSALLVASELVTDSVVHASAAPVLEVTRDATSWAELEVVAR